MTVTIGALCNRRIAESRLSPRQQMLLADLAAYPIGKVAAPGRSSDYIAHCTLRRKSVEPATVLHDILALRGVLAYAKPGWNLEHVTDAPIREAWRILIKDGLIGWSRRRSRIPKDEESAALKAQWLAKPRRSKVPMPDIIDFQDFSTRRISETCRLQRGDHDPVTHTILVRDMKHPKHKIGNHRRVALPLEAEEIMLRQPRLTTDPTERFFPYNPVTISHLYTMLVRECGFHDLTLRDSRRGGNTRLLKKYPAQYAMLVTGHETTDMPLTTYNGLDASEFHKYQPAT